MLYTVRCLEKVLYHSFEGPFVTGILGSRRVGKSTLIQHFLKRDPSRVTIELNMDDMVQREAIKAGQLEDIIITEIKRTLLPNQRVWVAIDEAQKCPEVFEQVKLLYDKYKDQDAIKFILTGSAKLELHRLSAESLAGRIQLFHLAPFGLSETLQLVSHLSPTTSAFALLNEESNIEAWQSHCLSVKPLQRDIIYSQQQLFLWGGLPEVLLLKEDADKLQYIASYLQTYLEKDVLPITTISDLVTYRQLMDISSEQTGAIRDDKRILQAISCHRDTLHKYRHYLQASLMYTEIYPYINSNLKRLVKSPKGYLLNNGLLSFLQGMNDLTGLIKNGKIGARVENWFLNELIIWLSQTPIRSEIYYWRTSTGMEVDFVVKKGTSIYPFEITYMAQVDKKKVRNLIAFRQYEPQVQYSYYVYNGEFAVDRENKILFIPMWAVV